MAWPPGVLPVNRTDSLSQQTNHPADHNAVNQAVNDTVAYVKLLGGANRADRRSFTTDANAEAFIAWTNPTPAAFPTGVFAVVVSDASTGVMDPLAVIVKVPNSGIALNGFLVRVFLHDGTRIASNGAITISYMAIGY
jgi:hypothetical protein